MKWSDGKPYYSLNQYYRDCFGKKAYKIALDIGSTCPNRDGHLSKRGCIYCSESGSGDYASRGNNLQAQIDDGIDQITSKYHGDTFIAYLQSFTNTYGDMEALLKRYDQILADPRIKGLAIATRPDCVSDAMIRALQARSADKPIWVELGLQSIHPKSSQFINRCYPLSVFDDTVQRLHSHNIPVIVHLIAGLPTETEEEFLESVAYMNTLPISGIKFHLLHVLKGTDLADYYRSNPFNLPTLDTYCSLIAKSISLLSPSIVIHRLTGDGPKDLMVAPLWSMNKRRVLNTIHQKLKNQELWQGKNFTL